MYAIQSLCDNANISQQTFYRLVRENDEFRTLVETNKQKKGNGFRYSEAVLQWLREYRGVTSDKAAPGAVECHQEPPERDGREKVLLDRTAALEGEITRLTAMLDSSEKERQALLQQNGLALLLLQQEKQEKMLLMPKPKRSLAERIKEFFAGRHG